MADTYKIGEAASLLNLKTYVLRFWETEFPDVVPLRTQKGQRLYTEEHLALLERIRYLLHDRGLTIGGARKILAEEKSRGAAYTFGGQRTPGDGSPAISPESPIDPYYDTIQEDKGPPPWARERETPSKRFSQYNLPGIARVPDAPPPAASDIACGEEAGDHFPDGPHTAATAIDDQRMLPLFGPVTAGTAKRESGENFIQAGRRAISPDQVAFEKEQELRAAREARDVALKSMHALKARSRADLLDILNELESIAALLRK